MNQSLHNKIMRKIYYAFVIRTAANPVLLFGFLLLALMIVLTYFVSLGNVIKNLLNVEIGQWGVFTYNAFTNTEAWTLLILGVGIFAALSLRVRLKAAPRHSEGFARY